ncbi:hypothetical protein [Citricoccus nitrophenolicus]
MKDGTYKKEEREMQLEDRDNRWNTALIEFGPMTRKQAAFHCGATETSAPAVMDSIRKRLDRHVESGMFQIDGDGRGKQTTYKATDVGREAYPGELPEEYIPDYGVTMGKNISTVVSQLYSPRPDSLLYPAPAGVTIPGYPLVARSRIAFHSDKMELAFNGQGNRERQEADLETWLNVEASGPAPSKTDVEAYDAWLDDGTYPVVPIDWDLRQLDEDTSAKISAFFRKRFRSESGHSKYVLPSYLLGVMDAAGRNAQAAIDFAIPLPHIENERGERALNAVACIVDIHSPEVNDEAINARLQVIANTTMPFTKIAVFYPADRDEIGTEYEKRWDSLIKDRLITHRFDGERDLILAPYKAVTGYGRKPNMAAQDRRGGGENNNFTNG